jgi:glycosyltransferase involved in cell wall biosynthesis
MKIAIIVKRLGPYHHARLRALARRADLLAIEVFKRDRTYAWDVIEGSTLFRKETLSQNIERRRQFPIRFGRHIEALIGDFKPDVVVVPGWAEPWALATMAFARRKNIPIVMMSESTRIDFRRHTWGEAIKSRVVNSANAYLVGGTKQKDYLVELGATSNSIFTGYDCVDNEYFSKNASKARLHALTLRKSLGLPPRFFLSSFRFVTKKNPFILLTAYTSYMAGNRSPWNLVILGDGPLRRLMEQKIIALGLSGKVLLPGFKQYHELPPYYGLAKAFILPSLSDQWGLVVNEAMASGLPVLVSKNCGCATDLVQEDKNGFIFDPRDENALAGLLRKLSSPLRNLQKMGQHSRKLIGAWSPQYFARNMKLACIHALNAPPRRTSFATRILLWFLERKLILRRSGQ